MTLTMIIIKTIVLASALIYTMMYIATLIKFCVEAVKIGRVQFPNAVVVITAFLWAIFYFLTF